MTPLFVDTSAFYALADASDAEHRRARKLLRQLERERRPLVTSTYVLDEALTLARMRIGHRAAVKLGERLMQTSWCRLVDVDDATRADAWRLFVRFADQTFSFTDCASFALMRSMGLREAFTFDRRDYAAAGFGIVP